MDTTTTISPILELELRPKKITISHDEHTQPKPTLFEEPTQFSHEECFLVTYFYKDCTHILSDYERELHFPPCAHATGSQETSKLPSELLPLFTTRDITKDPLRPSLPNGEPYKLCTKWSRNICILHGNCSDSYLSELDEEGRCVPPTRKTEELELEEMEDEEKMRRRAWWISEREVDRKRIVDEALVEKREEMRMIREGDERRGVPFAEREFLWDPEGSPNEFLEMVDVSELGVGEKACWICGVELSVEVSRRLPCGHVLDLNCIVKHLGEDNNNMPECPLCTQSFKLHRLPCYHFSGDENCQCVRGAWEPWGR